MSYTIQFGGSDSIQRTGPYVTQVPRERQTTPINGGGELLQTLLITLIHNDTKSTFMFKNQFLKKFDFSRLNQHQGGNLGHFG